MSSSLMSGCPKTKNFSRTQTPSTAFLTTQRQSYEIISTKVGRIPMRRCCALLAAAIVMTLFPATSNATGIVELTQITSGNTVDLYPAISPDGNFLLYQSYIKGNTRFDIAMINLEVGKLPRTVVNTREDDLFPAWLPDSRRFVFDTFRLDCHMVWIADAFKEASPHVQLSEGIAAEFDASVSPDGKHIALCSWKNLKKKDIRTPSDGKFFKVFSKPKKLPMIWIVKIDGSQRRQLIKGINPAWSPDGEWLAFASNESGDFEIYKIKADGSGLQNLTRSTESIDVEPTWSPDGRYIAFTSYRNKRWDIYMIKSDGSGLSQLTTHPAFDGGPSWAKNGYIYFHSDRDGKFHIWRFKPAGYSPIPPDKDKDGVLDNADRCPDQPEDIDGFEDEDGCPDPDNDTDGIKDEFDRCPTDAEDKDGWQDEDGCPDPDNDGDGIPDVKDAAPTLPET
ncbi:MAG TPA: hypothetical protein ENF73_00855, partial [Proteobacteria bacterium]|nr:hypothetical protein [Pseudomonadota bacterium]